MKLKICLMGLLCLFFRVSAQQMKTSVTKFSIGDTIPDLSIPNVLNYPNGTFRFSDVRNKVVILDFWATWCSSCINNFSKSFSLEKALSGKLQFLLVNTASTKDSKEKIQAFLGQRKKYYNFPCVFSDTVLDRMFPHKTLPHYVWILNNKIVAITDESELTEKNVIEVLSKTFVNIHQYKNASLNRTDVLFQDTSLMGCKALFKSVLIPFIDGMQNSSGFERDSAGNYIGLYVLNSSKLNMYRFAFDCLSGLPTDRLNITESDKSSFSPDSGSYNWRKNNCFSYQATFPACNRSQALLLMQHDLEKYFHRVIDSTIVTTECLEFKVTDRNKFSKSDPAVLPNSNVEEQTGAPVYFHNYSVKEVLQALERHFHIPIIDTCNVSERVNLNLPSLSSNPLELNNNLRKQGFELTIARSPVKFYRLSKIPN